MLVRGPVGSVFDEDRAGIFNPTIIGEEHERHCQTPCFIFLKGLHKPKMDSFSPCCPESNEASMDHKHVGESCSPKAVIVKHVVVESPRCSSQHFRATAAFSPGLVKL